MKNNYYRASIKLMLNEGHNNFFFFNIGEKVFTQKNFATTTWNRSCSNYNINIHNMRNNSIYFNGYRIYVDILTICTSFIGSSSKRDGMG